MSQESFDFVVKEVETVGDYIVSDANFSAYSYINKWPMWDLNIMLVYGPKACGKTYLANIWAKKAGAEFISPEDVYRGDYDFSRNYVLDDIERVHDEAALLHFFNSVKEAARGYLLLTAGNNPVNIGIRLADLRSRLGALPSAGISDPDSQILCQMMVKKFAERQLKVDIDVIKYIVSRMERSFFALEQAVELLDKQALKERKNITIPFVKKVISSQST